MAVLKTVRKDINGNILIDKQFGDFMDLGGTVGGDITVKKDWAGIKLENNKNAYFGHLYINPDWKQIDISTNWKGTYENEFLFSEASFIGVEKELGSTKYPWSKLWVAPYNRIVGAGYSALPNGLILQWGFCQVDILSSGTGINQSIALPIAFPTTSLARGASVDSVISATGGTWKASAFNLIASSDCTGIYIYGQNFGHITIPDTKCNIQWWAIGC